MAGNRRRKQDNSGVHAFLYVLVVLVLLCGMGYLFYYSRSQANERQEYIRELESKEAATKDVVQVPRFCLNLRLKVCRKVSQRLRARQSHKVL